MKAIKRTTANLPADLIAAATAVTGLSITETLIQGLTLVKRSKAYEKAKALQGQIDLDINLKESRER